MQQRSDCLESANVIFHGRTTIAHLLQKLHTSAAVELGQCCNYEKQHLMNENDFDECWMPWATPSAADDSASQIEAMCT